MTEASSFQNFLLMNGGENHHGPSPSGSEDEAEADMAQMMGFSSFSSKPKPLSKKRKRELSKLAVSGPGAESGSGSNTMPLGNPRRRQDRGEESKEWTLDSSSAQLDGMEISRSRDERRSEQVNGQHRASNPRTPTVDQGALSSVGKDKAPSATSGHQQHNWQALRKGVPNSRGDIAYYDASFIEDPWKDLR